MIIVYVYICKDIIILRGEIPIVFCNSTSGADSLCVVMYDIMYVHCHY